MPSPFSNPDEIRSFILRDQFLWATYEGFFRRIERDLSTIDGLLLEIGSGSGLAKYYFSEVITSDVVPNSYIDVVLRGDGLLPWKTETVANIFAINSFHHVPNIDVFLSEVDRILISGGRLILIEPYWGPLASVVYSLFHPERFNPFVRSWNGGHDDPWESNQALAWVVFLRDSHLFRAKFPNLRLTKLLPLGGLAYLFSGGVYGRNRIPPELLVMLDSRESRAGRWFDPFRLFAQIVIQKVDTQI